MSQLEKISFHSVTPTGYFQADSEKDKWILSEKQVSFKIWLWLFRLPLDVGNLFF